MPFSEEYSGEKAGVFVEEQAFRQIWMWLPMAIGAGLVWYFFFQIVVWNNQSIKNDGPEWILWLVWILVGWGLPILFLSMRLIVRVHKRDIYIRFRPFTSRRIPFSEIRSCTSRTYRPIVEYGGWGIRWSFSKGMAYNVSGKEGVQLVLTDDKQILIGSQRSEELAKAIRSAMNM